MKGERFWFWLAWKLPRKLVYWAGIRLWAFGTTGPNRHIAASELTVDEAIRLWGDP